MNSITRLDITGELDDNCPIIVLEEILNAHGIEYEKDLLYTKSYTNKILSRKELFVSKIKFPYTDKCYSVIACYVNNKVNWNLLRLIEAYDYLQIYTTTYQVPLTFNVGSQTPDNTFSLNACVLYRLCKSKGIITFRKMTIEQMGDSLKMFNSDLNTIKKKLFSIELNHNQVINMLLLTNNVTEEIYPNDEININTLKRCHDDLGINNLDRILPRTQNEAVMLACINYKIDLTKFENPYKEYFCLKNNGKNNYIPKDQINQLYLINKYIFDLNYTFVPTVPIELYNYEQLKKLCLIECINDTLPKEILYENLQLQYTQDTFYQGIWPFIEIDTTVIDLDHLSEVEPFDIVCYGTRDNSLIPYKISELINLFKNNKNFNSANGTKFKNIQKLKSICLNDIGNKDLKKELFEIICIVEHELQEIDERILKLKEYKEECIEILKCMLDLGMYMRGWNGKSDYPIHNVPKIDDIIVETNLNEQFNKLDNLYENLSKNCKKVVMNLPLLIYKENQYKVSNDKTERLTFFKRLELVKEGNTTRSMLSCVRLSSNWIVSSAYCFLMTIGITPNFDINLLEHIG